MAGANAVKRRLGIVGLDEIMLESCFFGLSEDALPIDHAAAGLGHLLHRVAKVLLARGGHGRDFRHVFYMYQREASGMSVEILDWVLTGDTDPAQVRLHLHQIRV